MKDVFCDEDMQQGGAESVLHILFSYYHGQVRYDFPRDFEPLHALVPDLPVPKQDDIFRAVCTLCGRCEKQAFAEGVKMAARFAWETTAGIGQSKGAGGVNPGKNHKKDENSSCNLTKYPV